MRDLVIPNHFHFVTRDRGDPSVYLEIHYKSEIQTPTLDKFSSETPIKREKSQSREMDSLDNICVERQALRDPSQERYYDQRLGKCDCDERLKNTELTGYFDGQPN